MGILPGVDEPSRKLGAFGKLILEGLDLLPRSLVQELLAALVEKDEKAAGGALGHLSFGSGEHEGFDDAGDVVEGGGLSHEATEVGPFKVGAEFVFVGCVGRRDVGGVSGGVGLTVAEAVEVVVAAVFVALVGGAAAAVTVGKNV